MRETVKLGVLGGTFDPVHSGHLIVAEEVRDILKLDRIMFIPARHPPHKQPRTISAVTHRLAMLNRAVASHPAFEINSMEIDRRGPSYTVDTLKTLNRQIHPEDLVFIMGHDSFVEIETWYHYEDLFTLCRLAVVSRPGTPAVVPDQFSTAVRRFFPEQVAVLDDPPGDGNRLQRRDWRICLMQIAGLKISASEIRRRVSDGRSIRYLVPESVRQYILEHRLYHDDSGGTKRHAHSVDQ